MHNDPQQRYQDIQAFREHFDQSVQQARSSNRSGNVTLKHKDDRSFAPSSSHEIAQALEELEQAKQQSKNKLLPFELPLAAPAALPPDP